MGAVAELSRDYAKRPQIGLRHRPLAANLLGCHVGPRAPCPRVDRHARHVEQPAQTEIDDYRSRPATASEDDVVGLDVAVDDLVGMQDLKAACDLPNEGAH